MRICYIQHLVSNRQLYCQPLIRMGPLRRCWRYWYSLYPLNASVQHGRAWFEQKIQNQVVYGFTRLDIMHLSFHLHRMIPPTCGGKRNVRIQPPGLGPLAHHGDNHIRILHLNGRQFDSCHVFGICSYRAQYNFRCPVDLARSYDICFGRYIGIALVLWPCSCSCIMF